MSVTSYDRGDEVRFTGTFTDSADAATDPSNVFVEVLKPGASAATSYEYGVDAALKKSTTGIYYIDQTLDTEGKWLIRFYSTVSGIAADVYRFRVLADKLNN